MENKIYFMQNKIYKRVSDKRGSKIPQHELLSAKLWKHIISGKISQFTYYSTTGDYAFQKHHQSITIYPQDYLFGPLL